MVERLVIDRIGHRGDGLVDGRGPDGGPLYVPGALAGETVEVENVAGHPDRRHLLAVEHASPERIAPICPHFGVCGGCALQHWASAPYRAWKRDIVVQALRQMAIDAPVAELIDAHGEGRRRAVFHARRGTHEVVEVGFSAARAHHVVPIDRCPVLVKELDDALPAAWAIAEALHPLEKPLDIQVTASDAGLDIDVRGSGPLSPRAAVALAGLAAARKLARLTRHGELVAQARAPTLKLGPAVVTLPPAAFLQATAAGEAALARQALTTCDALPAKAMIADLFAGIGPFALRLAARHRVLAVDSDAPALDALRRAAASTAGLKPVTVERRDLFRNALTTAELDGLAAVVFDPPRQGAQEQARSLAKSRVPLVIAVSCNAGTFARDMRHLLDGGYRLIEVTPVDQFRYSAHVEIVARLEK